MYGFSCVFYLHHFCDGSAPAAITGQPNNPQPQVQCKCPCHQKGVVLK